MPVEIALRKLRKKCLKQGIYTDVKKNMTHVSPLEKRKKKKILATQRAIRNSKKIEE